MAITVAELVAIPFVKLRFHAGVGGGARLINWAHASDLPNATDWLAPGDFLMSNGLSFPAGAEEQVDFLMRLVAAELSGYGIGDDMNAPALTAPFLARAEELDFPVLAIPHEVPFVALSRAVVNANSDEEHGRLVRTVKLYETLRGGVANGRLGGPLLAELGQQLGCRLLLIDTGTGLPVLPADGAVPTSLRARLVEEIRHRGGAFPGVLRVKHEDAVALAIRVPAGRPTALVAVQAGETAPDLALLQHAANIVGLEVERVNAERERARRLGGQLLAQLLERRLEPTAALGQLEEQGIDARTLVLVAFRPRPGADDGDLHHELAQRELPHLVLWNPQRCLVAVPDGDASLAALRTALGAVAFGVSDPLGRPDRAPDAAREARWAQTAAHNLGRSLVRYGEGTPLFLPRTLGEAAMAAERVLGPVIAYDTEHGTELIRSLAAFLEQNRSWQRSAQVLHVHKQTLVYRMHRIEELTGRNLRDTADVVQFWLALRALEFAHGELTTDEREAS